MPTPLQYIGTLEEPRKSEMKQVFTLMKKAAPTLKPFVHETAHGTVIGFGKCAYESKSGCSGEWFTAGLASRKGGIAIYICAAKNGKYLLEHYAKSFPKAKLGKSCLTVKKLEDVDLKVVVKMLKEAEKLGMCFA